MSYRAASLPERFTWSKCPEMYETARLTANSSIVKKHVHVNILLAVVAVNFVIRKFKTRKS